MKNYQKHLHQSLNPNIVKKRHWSLEPEKLAIGPAVWSFGLYS